MAKDREQTEGRILDAAFATLAEDGLPGFGINAVARRAGCDKKLIYRYFDGPDGLLVAMGQASGQAMAAALDRVLDPPPVDYADLVGVLTTALAEHLATDSHAREAARVALAAPDSAAAPFRATRAAVLRDWFQAAKAKLGVMAPDGTDAVVVNAVLIAGVEALAVAGSYAGVTLSDAGDRARVALALRRLAAGAYPARLPPGGDGA